MNQNVLKWICAEFQISTMCGSVLDAGAGDEVF